MRKNWLIQNTAARFVHSNCNLGRFAIVALFLLSFLVSGAWAVCESPSLYNIPISPTCYFPSPTQNGCGNCCQNATIPRNVVVTSSFYSNSSGPGMPYTCGCRISNPLLTTASGDNGYATGYVCNNECEADSLQCANDGGTWTNTGASTCNGYSCKMSNCLQSDTLWLNDSKAACDAIGGENNYAITDIDETCVHSGICCPSDSALVGNTCKWRCYSLYTVCTAKNGYLYAGVLQDTTVSGADSTFTNKCYYNCSYAYNKDSTTSVTDGNTACSSPSTPIADCTRMPNDFSSVRTTYGDSVYSYDFLTPGSAAYIDSIVLTPCSRFMYRCTVNGKYKYWYSDADIPTGCTNIVKIK